MADEEEERLNREQRCRAEDSERFRKIQIAYALAAGYEVQLLSGREYIHGEGKWSKVVSI